MKRETARYVAKCDMCQRVKADHMRPVGLLQPLNILAWKLEEISMDFIVGLPLSARKFDSGDHGSVHQVCSLHSGAHQLQG
jgi:hypothetical protein